MRFTDEEILDCVYADKRAEAAANPEAMATLREFFDKLCDEYEKLPRRYTYGHGPDPWNYPRDIKGIVMRTIDMKVKP